MPTTYRIAPSLLSADFSRLGEEVRAVVAAGADMIHFDVMDNHYVPNLTIGPLVCAAIKPHTSVPIDVHLMVKPVDRIVPDFANAGAAIISFHPEASEHVDRTIGLIHDHGVKAGLVFNPATPLDWLMHVIDKLDLVLIMSVNPGFGGQSFIPHALDKLRAARKLVDMAQQRTGRPIMLEVDGGVKVDNIAEIARGGRGHVRRRQRDIRRRRLSRDDQRDARRAGGEGPLVLAIGCGRCYDRIASDRSRAAAEPNSDMTSTPPTATASRPATGWRRKGEWRWQRPS